MLKTTLKEIYEDKLIFIGIIILTALFVVALFYWVYLFYFVSVNDLPVSANKDTITNQIKQYPFYSYLDGTGVDTQEEQMPNTVAVMIDNYPDARPQIGLDKARIVYEVLVEGGVTRFMAIFNQSDSITQVGPIRSARPYFFDWINEYGDPIYMHSGGSPEALKTLKNSSIFDADEFAYSFYYWRDYNYYAPHNLFTSSNNWQKLFTAFGSSRASSSWQGWKFGKISATSTDSVKTASIKYSINNIVRWDYSINNKIYNRFINDSSHANENGEQIFVNNIIIQYVPSIVIDEIGRRKMTTLGSGEARVLRDGKIIRGSWKKLTLNSRTRFFDKQEKEIELSQGKTWVQIVPEGTELILVN